MAASSSSSSGEGGRRGGGGFFRNAFQAMSDWGDDFERRHFEGDFKGALTNAPKKVKAAGGTTFKAMSDWGDDFERRHFEGDFLGTLAKAPQAAGAVIGGTLESVDEMLEGIVPLPEMPPPAPLLAGQLEAPASQVPRSEAGAERPWEALQRQQERQRAQGREAPEGAAAPALWGAAERLKQELAQERERRRGRASALDALAEAVRVQRADVAEERQLAAAADERRSVSDSRAYTSERELAQMQERHHALLSRRAMHDAELAQHSADTAAAAQAIEYDEQIRAEEGPRAWARAGPEMEALKNAKVELAEVLGLLDEARLHRRRELNAMEARIGELAAANKRYRLASDGYEAPGGSFRKSLRQLFAVAKG